MVTTIQPVRQSRDGARGKIPRCDRRSDPSFHRHWIPAARWCAALLLLSCCRESGRAKPLAQAAAHTDQPAAAAAAGAPPTEEPVADGALLPVYDDLGAALTALAPPGTRVLGLGELHARTDRPAATSALARFTAEGLPALAPRMAHLVLETWAVTGDCGEVAARATAAVAAQVRRPRTTQRELGALVARSQALRVAAHAMTVRCEDYQVMAKGDDAAIAHLLDLTTSELGRLGAALVARTTAQRPLVVIYGGAMHNDREPQPGLEPWSYAAAVEAASEHTFVEVDLVVPELGLADPTTMRQPWAHLLGKSPKVVAVRRGERAYTLLLPASSATPPHADGPGGGL